MIMMLILIKKNSSGSTNSTNMTIIMEVRMICFFAIFIIISRPIINIFALFLFFYLLLAYGYNTCSINYLLPKCCGTI